MDSLQLLRTNNAILRIIIVSLSFNYDCVKKELLRDIRPPFEGTASHL
jgi:hypothetical protein